MTPTRVARCVLTDLVALIAVLVISVVMAQKFHIPAAILVIQLFAIELLSQSLPISKLRHEKSKPKARNHVHVKIEVLAFGILAAVIAYLSYLLFFGYHTLSPEYIDTSNLLYRQATTVALVTLAFCQAINVFFVRADHHKQILTDYLLSNKQLVRAYGVSLSLIVILVYAPWLQSIFHTAAIGLREWAAAILCAGLYGACRRLQRYTKKHTRHEVVKLHHKLHGPN